MNFQQARDRENKEYASINEPVDEKPETIL